MTFPFPHDLPKRDQIRLLVPALPKRVRLNTVILLYGSAVRKLSHAVDKLFMLCGLLGIGHGEKIAPQLWRGGHALRRDDVQRSRRAGC